MQNAPQIPHLTPVYRERVKFTAQEMYILMHELRYTFDIVRLVSPNNMHTVVIDADGTVTEQQEMCCSFWHTNARCNVCISMAAITGKKPMSRFSFVDDSLYSVTSKYVEVDGKPYSLELVVRVSDRGLTDGIEGKNLLEVIASNDERMFKDPVTGAYNRRYYQERWENKTVRCGVAMVDMDNLKKMNDTYGHAMGDTVLRKIAEVLSSCIRPSDVVARYGGDEFVIVFNGLPQNVLKTRLQSMCERVNSIPVKDHPEARVSVSIGGAYGEGRVGDLLKVADGMLYEAKKKRNCVCVSEESQKQ